MNTIIEILNKYRLRRKARLITLNELIERKNVTIEDAKRYNVLLHRRPKRTDFIKYDDNGHFMPNHKPMFKGWELCKDTSSEKHKVAKMVTKGSSFKIYFDTANGVTVVSLEHMVDEVKYNDLAIFFQGQLELNQ